MFWQPYVYIVHTLHKLASWKPYAQSDMLQCYIIIA